MPELNRDRLRTLLAGAEPPCVSVYLPTSRSYPDSQQDSKRFRNLVLRAEETLKSQHPTRDARAVLEPFNRLADDPQFWRPSAGGLAILAAPGRFETIRLPREVPELAVVADSFHVKPLIRHVQSADRFQLLALTQTTANMFEGNRYGLEPLELPADFPENLEKAVGEEVKTNDGRTGHSLGNMGQLGGKENHGFRGMVSYGRASKKDEVDSDTGKFFQMVDRAVQERFSNLSGLPLILACLPQHATDFRKVCQNRFLLPETVLGNPRDKSPDQLRQEAWQILEPHYLARLEKLKEDYRTAFSRGLGSDDVATVAKAAAASRVGTLLVDADKLIPGKFERDSGEIWRAVQGEAADDMLDDIAELVLARDGVVVVVPSDRMPSQTGVTAMYRF